LSYQPAALTAKAHLPLVNEVELGQHVETVRDERALVEIAVAVVEIRAADDLAVLRLGPGAEVVAQGVVPAHLDVRIADVDVERLDGARHGEQCRYGERRRLSSMCCGAGGCCRLVLHGVASPK
jgi:hypothetical protein